MARRTWNADKAKQLLDEHPSAYVSHMVSAACCRRRRTSSSTPAASAAHNAASSQSSRCCGVRQAWRRARAAAEPANVASAHWSATVLLQFLECSDVREILGSTGLALHRDQVSTGCDRHRHTTKSEHRSLCEQLIER